MKRQRTQKTNKELTGGQIVIQCLQEWGVDHLFGLPGTPITPIFDALCDSNIHPVLSRHESGAGFMASGYARVSGKPGVCLVTAGPGPTNTITPIADAFLDSIPLIVIAGQVHRHVPEGLSGENLLQELPLDKLVQPIVKYTCRVDQPQHIAAHMRKAFSIALSGRPGPVMIEVPTNVASESAPYREMRQQKSTPKLTAKARTQIDKLAHLIRASKRPLILLGGGVVHAQETDQARKFVERLGIPSAHTLVGSGILGADNQLNAGLVGRFGQQAASQALHNCDLLIVLGARLDEYAIDRRHEPAELAHIVSINIDPDSVENWIPLSMSITADMMCALDELTKITARINSDHWHTWRTQVKNWKKLNVPEKEQKNCAGPAPELIVQEIEKQTHANARVIFGAGNHTVWGMQNYHPFLPRSVWMSGGLGTMGFALPVAIGAQLACPNDTIICIDGDGSFQMSVQELATAKQENTPIKLFLMDNKSLGMIRQNQEAFFGRTIAVDLSLGNPDFCALGRSYGWNTLEIRTPAQIKQVVEQALAATGPTLVVCHIDPRCNVHELRP